MFAPKVFSLMACCGNTMLDFASSIHASLNCALTFVNQLIPTLAVPKPAKPKSQHVACLELLDCTVCMWRPINPYTHCAMLLVNLLVVFWDMLVACRLNFGTWTSLLLPCGFSPNIMICQIRFDFIILRIILRLRCTFTG